MKKLLISMFAFAVLSVAGMPNTASAALRDACVDPGTSTSAFCTDTKAASDPSATNPISGPDGVIVKVARIVAIAAGAVAVIILLIASIQYITANGDSNNIKKARETILYCLIGLVVIALAQTLVQFIVNRI